MQIQGASVTAASSTDTWATDWSEAICLAVLKGLVICLGESAGWAGADPSLSLTKWTVACQGVSATRRKGQNCEP